MRRPMILGMSDAERRARGAEAMIAWRKRHGLNQAEAALLLGVSQVTVSWIETARQRGPSEPVQRLMELADAREDGLEWLGRLADGAALPPGRRAGTRSAG